MTDGDDIWWRCEIRAYSVADEWGDHGYTTHQITWQSFRVVKTTPKGVWVRGFLGSKTFILGTATRQLAVPTKEIALNDAIARKERHVRGCEARLSTAQKELGILEREKARHDKLEA